MAADESTPPMVAGSPVSGDFSLVLGGPLYQLWLRTRLARAPLDFLHRRILFLTVIAWLPLLILNFLVGTVWSGKTVPFLHDIGAQARLLGALPLLIWAELLVHTFISREVRKFEGWDLIAPSDVPRYRSAIAVAMRLRNSIVLELLQFAVAVFGGHLLWQDRISPHVDTWYFNTSPAGGQFTLPGYWYVAVSLPLFRFLLLRWYFRLVIWYGLMWRVSRLSLKLNALHPDGAGGLGFLSNTIFAFLPVLQAQAIVFAGMMFDRIWHLHETLPTFQMEIVGILLWLTLLPLIPPAFFVLQLMQAKRVGLSEYGGRALQYVNAFRRKWLAHNSEPIQNYLGSADIQSLSDLGQSFEVIEEMRPFPFTRRDVLALAIMIALPMAPLALTMISVESILQRVLMLML